MSRALSASPGEAPAPMPGGFEAGYTTGDGARLRVPLADAAAVRFADMQPARRFRARKGQWHLPGRWWSATDGRHVGYESWLERDQAMWLGWDEAVTGNRLAAVPAGSHPSPWPAPGADMRYWPMCVGAGTSTLPTIENKLPDGQADYGCRADQETRVNAAGDYPYVIGSEAQRAAISRVVGVTFLPFSDNQTTPLYLLWLSNYLVNPGFAHSAQAVTQAEDAPAAAAAMGPYYPRVSTCALATLTAKGIAACEP